MQGDAELKEYTCVQVKNHKDVGKQIMQWQKNGWRLHTYSCAQVSVGADAYHYLLFERGE
jgi:nitrogen fixation protein